MTVPASFRITIATTGSLGDLHPFLVLGAALRGRGHAVTLATASLYRPRVRAAGLEWRRLRPELPAARLAELGTRLMHGADGLRRLTDELLIPHLGHTAADLLDAAGGSDLLIGHSLVMVAASVAERLAIPYAAAILQPKTFASAHDLFAPAACPALWRLHPLGRLVGTPMRALARHWWARYLPALRALRRELGLPPEPARLGPDAASAVLNLALFSPLLGRPRPDWPAQTVLTGFLMQHEGAPLAPELAAFLAAGPPPIVFTLGSSAAHAGADFYRAGLAAAAELGRRAVLLTGQAAPDLPATLPDWAARADYAPFDQVFASAAAVVCPAGIGTIALALRAGRPLVVVPFAHDQLDNAARLLRLGAARWVPRRHCTGARLAAALRTVLTPAVVGRAEALRRMMAGEDGIGSACAAVEALLEQSPSPHSLSNSLSRRSTSVVCTK